MIDLFGNRANEKYTYRRVYWPTLEEGPELGNVISGWVELSAFSDLKATCNFTFEGGEAPNQNDLVRIYYSFDDDYGEHAEFCIGTFFIGYSGLTNVADYELNECTGLRISGTADGWSTLKVLQDITLGYRYTVHAGDMPVQVAIQKIRETGLKVNVASESSYTLSGDHTFEPSDTLLTAVNWLLTTAGYQAPYVSSEGIVQISRYVDPSDRDVQAVFKNDENSIMYPEVQEQSDWQTTPNVYKLDYSDDTIALHAEARNLSGSKASLDARGNRELSVSETVMELAGEDASEMKSKLEEMTTNRLLDVSAGIEHVSLSHPYIPLVANDAVTIQYAEKTWSGSVQNIHIDLSTATRCDTTIRKFVPVSINVVASSAIDWESS